MKQLRYAFKLMWREAPRHMRKYKIKAVDQFDKRNSHGGVCWGWPNECKLTNVQARSIFYACYKRRQLTIHQLIVVRKGMAYAWELAGGLPGGNYPGVKEVWKIVRESNLADGLNSVKPVRVPTPEELKTAFTKEWVHPDDRPLRFQKADQLETSMTLVQHCSGLVQAYDWAIFGLRSVEDVKRVKRSLSHQCDWDRGWQCTDFVGGRAKLCGTKKGNRPWKIWRVCFCPGGRHIRPPADFWLQVGPSGNPDVEVKWCTVCPLACVEFLWQFQEAPRSYAKWLPASGRFGAKNVANVTGSAIDWLVNQGACPKESRYSTNAGRKSLAAWTGLLKIDYRESFQIHGDQSRRGGRIITR